jgi:hypothetical protein
VKIDVLQYSLWRAPIDPDARIPADEEWWFTEPFQVFEIFTLASMVKRRKDQLPQTVNVGKARIPAKLVIKARTVTIDDEWQETEL